jgi:hypothetical protein
MILEKECFIKMYPDLAYFAFRAGFSTCLSFIVRRELCELVGFYHCTGYCHCCCGDQVISLIKKIALDPIKQHGSEDPLSGR